jgi:hypothetical protein
MRHADLSPSRLSGRVGDCTCRNPGRARNRCRTKRRWWRANGHEAPSAQGVCSLSDGTDSSLRQRDGGREDPIGIEAVLQGPEPGGVVAISRRRLFAVIRPQHVGVAAR